MQMIESVDANTLEIAVDEQSAEMKATDLKAEVHPVEAISEEQTARKIEAALLTADRAIGPARLAEALDGISAKQVSQAVSQLNEEYEKTNRSFRIETVAGGWKMMTLQEYGPLLKALKKKSSKSRLSPAAMEALAIVAYRQPVLRAQIESIRGAASGEVLRGLMDVHLVKIAGRAEEIGRPILYGTTKTFLEVFGLSSLEDLPKVEGQ